MTHNKIGVGGPDSLDDVTQVTVVQDGDVVDDGEEHWGIEVAIDENGDDGQVCLGGVAVVSSLDQELLVQTVPVVSAGP